MHPLVLEADEMQDYPEQGWTELIETMKAGSVGAQWRCHGVSRGVRDTYYRMTTGENPDLPFKVHRYMAPHRPTWSNKERRSKIAIYGGTEDNVDYRRNIFGEHGDTHNPVFVLARLMACFVPGTPVTTPTTKSGFTPIELVEVGDVVGNAAGTGVVTVVQDSWRDSLVVVTLDGGERLYCTPEHPFATSRGWDNADQLQPGDTLWPWDRAVRGVRGCDPDFPEVLLQDLHREMAGAPVSGLSDGSTDLLDVRVLSGDVLSTVEGREVLLPALRQSQQADEGQAAGATSLRDVSTGVRAKAGRPEVLFGQLSGSLGQQHQASAGAPDAGGDGRAEPGAFHSMAGLGSRVAAGVLDQPPGGGAGGYQLSTRSGTSRREALCGSRRSFTSSSTQEGQGSATRRVVDLPRVASVEVLRPGHPDFDRLSGGADQVRVIDLTVSGHPSFAVGESRVLVHNCVRINENAWATEYNERIYHRIKVNDELLRKTGMPIEGFLDGIPGTHLSEDYASYWSGMDVGFTNDPSEILVFGVVKKTDVLRLLLRIQLQRVSAIDQANTIMEVFRQYGPRLRGFSMDKTGNGLPIWQETMRGGRLERHSERIKGYGFSEKKAVEFDDRPLERRERPQDAVIERNVVDFATDELRKLVDQGKIELPYDLELLTEWQGQQVTAVKDMGSAGAVRRKYSDGGFHTLDAGRTMIMGKQLENIESVLNAPRRQGPVLDQFFA